MKKIEASMIKRLLRINSKPFFIFSLAFSLLLSLSHTLVHLYFLGAPLEECGILGIWSKQVKERKEITKDNKINNYNGFFF